MSYDLLLSLQSLSIYSLSRYLVILSHRSIAILYLQLAIFSGLIAFLMSLIIRIELGMVNIMVFRVCQDYNLAISAHGLLMIFFFVMPFAISFFGNLLIPILLLSHDLALPSSTLSSNLESSFFESSTSSSPFHPSARSNRLITQSKIAAV